MKHRFLLSILLAIAAFTATAAVTNAQTVTGTVPVKWVSSLPSTCSTSLRSRVLVYKYTATSGLYWCSSLNTWTYVSGSSFSTVVLGPNGTPAAPTFSFSSDPDTGMFRSGANALGFSTGGTERATLSSAGLWTTTGGVSSTTGTFSGVVDGANGTGAAPSFTFTSDPDTGVFRSGANALGLSTGGTERFTLTSSGHFFPFVTSTYDLGGSSNLFRDAYIGRQAVVTQGAITASTPFITQTATWNNAGVTFVNLFANVTDTASAAGSLLVDLQVGGSSKFKVGKAGDITIPGDTYLRGGGSGLTIAGYNASGGKIEVGSTSLSQTIIQTSGDIFTHTGSGLVSQFNVSGVFNHSGNQFGWAGTTTVSDAKDTGLARQAAGVIRCTDGSTAIRCLQGGGTAVASAAAMPLPTGRVFHVTGTTNITSITSTAFAAGVCITLIFDDVLTFTDGNNLKLAGNFATTADDTISLCYDGTNWFETARSIN